MKRATLLILFSQEANCSRKRHYSTWNFRTARFLRIVVVLAPGEFWINSNESPLFNSNESTLINSNESTLFNSNSNRPYLEIDASWGAETFETEFLRVSAFQNGIIRPLSTSGASRYGPNSPCAKQTKCYGIVRYKNHKCYSASSYWFPL